ncbi:MAG: hypothetical protein JXR76_22005 [Deltaproteobacteria bacterium]|nr:hypothetical protein [Deltaproteobacteria bacterium]
MKFNRHWIYPKVRIIHKIIPYVLVGGIISGAYGAIHDQISYAISPEYFTHFKFHQFHYADFGLPNRVFVAIIGFLATWWVGAIVGWFIARVRFNSDDLTTARRDILRGFGIVFGCAVVAFCVGAILGWFMFLRSAVAVGEGGQAITFMGWERELSEAILQRFAMVGVIHNSSYLGGVVGLVVALVVQRRRRKLSIVAGLLPKSF